MEQTITLSRDKYYEGIQRHKDGQLEFITDLILEYYEDGKYHYSNFKEDGKAVDGKARSVKFDINKWLKSAYTKKYLGIIFEYLFEVDEDIPKKQSEKISELKKQLKDIINDKDNVIEKTISNEVELRVSDYREQEKDRIQFQSERIQKLTSEVLRLEEAVAHYSSLKTNTEKELKDKLLETEIENKNLREEIKKKSVGRPKLSKKEKKENRKKKAKEEYKKKMQQINNESESDTEWDNESVGSDSD